MKLLIFEYNNSFDPTINSEEYDRIFMRQEKYTKSRKKLADSVD